MTNRSIHMRHPFTDPSFVCDSSLHGDSVVEQTTSWLTINPVKGCSVGCKYCFRLKWHPSPTPKLVVTPHQAVHALISNKLFIPNETPIAINVSSTDAFLPAAREATIDCLKLLEKKQLKNIVGLITKLEISDREIAFIKTLDHLRLVILVSYAEVPKEIEPIPVEPRIRTLQRLKDANVPSVLYFRPVVPGWNDSESQIIRVLRTAEAYADAIAIGGLRVSDEIRSELETVNAYKIPHGNSFHPKTIDDHVTDKIVGIYRREQFTTPMFKHTSCAVSFLFKMPNYNALFRAPERNCMDSCPRAQCERCFSEV